MKINTTFGPVTGFNKIGQFTSNLIVDETIADELLCFESDSFPFYQVSSNINCTNNIILGMQENVFPDIQIFPNPFYSHIKINNLNQDHLIKIFDLTGRLILQVENIFDSVEIDTNEIKRGVYFIQIYTEGALVITKKIVKL